MRLIPAIAIVVTGAVAHADNKWEAAGEHVQGGAYLHYELSGLTAVDDAMPASKASELVLAGARLHGFLGEGASVGYQIGGALFAGSTLRGGGFAYDVAVFPIGMVVRFGKTSIVGVSTGVGASGAVGTLDDAITVPVEAVVELGNSWRVLGRARFSYVAGADSRQSAAPSAPFADELDAMLGLRFGKHYDQHGFPSGNGYFVAVSYRELADTRFAGLTIGYSIDLAMPRRFIGSDRK